MMLEMQGRTVLITGASGGLGRSVVDAFLAAGAEVAAVSRSGEGPRGIAADLTGDEACRKAVAEAIARLGRIDALVHLLGGFAGGERIENTGDATWERMLALNLRAAFYTFRAVLPHMRERGYGRIVAVGSRTAVEPAAGLSAYNVSKAGLVALVRTLAAETKGSGITANVVLPSVIDTPANRAADPAADPSRWVQPESIAQLLLWLASEASADVSGAVIPIYGAA